jgi:cell division protein FtsZ
MPINLRAPDVKELKPRITVLGVGGAGGNAVNNMINARLEGVEFVVANTDAQALAQSKAERKIQIGARITEGLGAGAKPEVGRAAAEETLDELLEHLGQSHMLFITAGMGGGTGTGAAPVIARAARELGILTVGVVTKPFEFEGAKRMRLAEHGLEEMQNYVDTLIIIPNQNLFRIANERTTFAQAFAMADEVLHSGVRGVTDLMVVPGLINLDFADIKTVMMEMGKAMMGTGEAEGEGRALKAAEAAISNPLLDDVSMKGARGVLVNVTGGPDLMLFEVDEAANRIRAEVDPDANIIFGSTINPDLEGRVRVSVVATGIEAEAFEMPTGYDGKVERLHPRKRFSGLDAPAASGARMSEPAAEIALQTANPVHAQMAALEIDLSSAAATAAEASTQEAAETMELGGADAPVVESNWEWPESTPVQPVYEVRERRASDVPAQAPMSEPKRRFGLFGGRKRDTRVEPAAPVRQAPKPAHVQQPLQATAPRQPSMPAASVQPLTSRGGGGGARPAQGAGRGRPPARRRARRAPGAPPPPPHGRKHSRANWPTRLRIRPRTCRLKAKMQTRLVICSQAPAKMTV